MAEFYELTSLSLSSSVSMCAWGFDTISWLHGCHHCISSCIPEASGILLITKIVYV